MAVTDVLGGLFGGLASGLNVVEQRRRQAIADQLRQRQADLQERNQGFNEFMKKLEALPPDMDVDPELMKEGATLGLSSLFTKSPTGFRRVEGLAEKADRLKLEAANLQNQMARYDYDRYLEAKSPDLFARLQTQYPDAGQRRFVAENVYGIKADPTTLTEQQAEKKFEAQNAASVYAAQIRSANSMNGLNTNQAWLRAIEMALRTTPVDPVTKRPDPAAYEREVQRHFATLTGQPTDLQPAATEQPPGWGEWLRSFFPGAKNAATPAQGTPGSTRLVYDPATQSFIRK